MTTYERRQSLLELLRKQPSLRIPDLARNFKVSQGTIRNDFDALETQGRVMRVHGGVILSDQEHFHNDSFLRRFQMNALAKQAIARHAASLVSDGDSILLDASSTAYYLARVLAGRQKLRVITNGFEVARELAQNLTNTVILIGGVVNNETSSVTGLLSEKIIAELHVDKAFVSCSGFSLDRGLTEVNLEEAQLKRKIILSAHQVIALIDSSKFGKVDLTPFVGPGQITQLISDTGLTSEWVGRVQEAGISFTLVDLEAIPIS